MCVIKVNSRSIKISIEIVTNPNTVPTKTSFNNEMGPYPSAPTGALSSASETTIVNTLRNTIFASKMGLPPEAAAEEEEPSRTEGTEADVTLVGAGETASRVWRRDWDSSSLDGGSVLVRFDMVRASLGFS
jgi:hypothetical protein